MYLNLGFEAGEVEEPAIGSCPQVYSFRCTAESVLQDQSEEDPKDSVCVLLALSPHPERQYYYLIPPSNQNQAYGT